MQKTSKNPLIKKFTSPFSLIVLNTTKLSNSFHDQTFLRNTIFSFLIWRVNLSLNGLRNALMDNYIFSIQYKRIHFYLSLYPEIHRMGNKPDILYPRCKEQKESQLYFIFYCKLSKITPDFIRELINLKYAFNIPLKITLKTRNFFSLP